MQPNPKDLIGQTKTPIHLVPASAIRECAWAFKLGADKYGAYNWREHPVLLSVYVSAAMRHILAMWDGEWTDPESGHPHAAHAAACMMLLMDAKEHGCAIEDYPTSSSASSS